MQIKEQQQRDSIRFVWNAMASNKTLQARATVPQALHYSPLDYNQNTILQQSPPTCMKCGSYMNPYNRIELGKQNYKCCICKTSNKVPENYFQDKEKMPPELTLGYSTFLMAGNQVTAGKDIGLVFLVDIALSEKELMAVKQSMLDLTKTLNNSKNVALITYDRYVQLHDLTSEMQSIITFSPNQQIDSQSFLNLLAIKKHKVKDLQDKFVAPLDKCRSTFTQKVSSLQKAKASSYKAQRESRAVGQALNIALLLCQTCQLPLRIVFFCGGICTIGVGKIIEPEFKVEVRSIKQQLPKQSVSAKQFYKKLGQKAKINSTAIDSFIFSVQEVGLTEMLPCLKSTNGLLVQHQEFSSKIFKQSFHKAYIGSQQCPSLSLATQSWIQFKCSSEIHLTGFQGKQKIQQEKDKVHARFYVGNLNETTTVTALFQQAELNTQSQAFYIQICTVYRDTQNLNVEFLRVTTVRRPFVQTAADMIASFDQEAALYLIAKLCVSYPQNQKAENIRKWLDNLTIKWTAMFGLYRKGVWQSFQLPVNVRLFPQFIYYLRRNIVVRKSRVSLDEYSYICEIMKWQSIRNVLLIIQPALLMYTPENTYAVPIGLDQKYMKSEVILILDSFFNIVEWRGKHIQGWYQENYHLSNEYGYMQDLYQNTNRDIQELKSQRFPAPTVYITWPNHSKQRFIKSRLGNRQEQQQQSNISEQADIKSFTSKLIQIVVNN